MKKLVRWCIDLWRTLSKPARYLSLGVVALSAFIMGILFWGAFNTALELTNTEEFCTSCHEMRDNVYQELQQTVHWSNHSGVRATCPDCHVPHEWTHKIARKMQASKEVWGKIFGTINTKEKFEAKRLELASHEWARLSANGSLECKNCHSYQSMKWEDMSPLARKQMKIAAEKDQSCIDCHKGIAHKLPEMRGRATELLAQVRGQRVSEGEQYYSIVQKPLRMELKGEEGEAGTLNTATKVTVLERKGLDVYVEIDGWRKRVGLGRIINQDFGLNINSLELSKAAAAKEGIVSVSDEKEDELTGLIWQKVKVKVWMDDSDLTDTTEGLWAYAGSTYKQACSQCHVQPEVAHFDANTWPGMYSGMIAFVNFDGDTQNLVLKYLQSHSSTFSDKAH
ncbi:nitrate reductase [Endozoicomonas sp. (ex Bugula neritina AB1)]|nr:nitrate reductase [Endozoicomonas sp. (ex Bugula neritina AB1)]